MTISPEQFQMLLDVLNKFADAVGNIGEILFFLGFLFLIFKKMG